jgi:hypothetical protein
LKASRTGRPTGARGAWRATAIRRSVRGGGYGAPFGLKPNRQEPFKLSTDPDFVAKVRDVVGLYLSPPEHALVLCVGEKWQIQALDRSQTVFPMRPGQPERRSHDYVRHGTTSLFAAFDIATGEVIGLCYPHHRAAEFRQFLDEIEARVPANLDVHLVWDNYATHKTALTRNWLANQAWRASQCRRARSRDKRHSRLPRCCAEAVPEGQIRRRHTRRHGAVLHLRHFTDMI